MLNSTQDQRGFATDQRGLSTDQIISDQGVKSVLNVIVLRDTDASIVMIVEI